jgi:hypothetical protein
VQSAEEMTWLLAAWRSLGVAIGGLPADLLAFEFLGQFTLQAFLFSGLEKKGVSLDLLNDAFLLDLPLETAKGAFDGFAIENPDFCQNVPPLEFVNQTVSMGAKCAKKQ